MQAFLSVRAFCGRWTFRRSTTKHADLQEWSLPGSNRRPPACKANACFLRGRLAWLFSAHQHPITRTLPGSRFGRVLAGRFERSGSVGTSAS